MASILIKNGLLVDSRQSRHMDLLIRDSKIARIEKDIDSSTLGDDCQVIHAEGLCILPGIIDAHTHYHLVSRGTVTADSFRQASRLAAYGGVTTVVDFADDDKKSLISSFLARRREMKEMAIDYGLHQGVYGYRPTIASELSEIRKEGVKAIKLFTTYKNVGYMVDDPEELERIISEAERLGMIVTIHCEDDEVIQHIDSSWKGSYLPKDHADMRPSLAEAEAIRKLGELCGRNHLSLYIVHLSSKLGLEEVRKLRSSGVDVVVETTPHYLFLDRSLLEGEKGPLYVMTPPLRTKEDNLALQEALVNGEIQVVATDHCSFTFEQKLESHDVRTIYPGIPGTEEMLALVNSFAYTSGKMSLNKVVELLSTNPARLFGLYPEKGSLEIGTDADLCLFNPDESWVIGKDSIHSAAGYSCYEGQTVTGKVVMTFLRGRLIMGDGIYLGLPGDGRFLKGK